MKTIFIIVAQSLGKQAKTGAYINYNSLGLLPHVTIHKREKELKKKEKK